MITGWYDVSKEGLANLLERRGRAFAILELLQNAWDTRCSTVEVELSPLPNRAEVMIRVTDDDPEGFTNLAHAYTLFAPSGKGANPEQRGRFNLGEKLVLACCREAIITTTTGRVTFQAKGRTLSKHRRERGSEFMGYLSMTREQLATALDMVRMALPPDGVRTMINGVELQARPPIATIRRQLPTEIADAEGRLRRSARMTDIRILEPMALEEPYLYEMGIPVVALADDRFHIDVRQKVPLPFDRDSVTPAYLAAVRAAALDAAVHRLSAEETSTRWVTDAMENADTATVVAAVKKRFGDKIAAFDPSDLEANHRVVAQGYTVVPGAALPKAAWNKLREAGAAPAAGKIAPTHPEAVAASDTIATADWTPGMRRVARWAAFLAHELLAATIEVRIIRSLRSDVVASWQRLSGSKALLTFNLARLGHEFFNVRPLAPSATWMIASSWFRVNELLIHEMGHQIEANHLSDAYHDALCNLGARLFDVALSRADKIADILRDEASDAA